MSDMEINVLMGTDINYVDYTKVAIYSARINTPKSVGLAITVLCDSQLGYNARASLLDLSDKVDNLRIQFQEINYKDFTDAKAGLFPVVAYYRLIAAEIIKSDKCIYLDGDIIVETDLADLYNIELGDNYVAGVKDMNYVTRPNHAAKNLEPCLLEDYEDHINAGVLVFNLKKIRNNNIEKKFLSEMQKYTMYQDQDIINRVCHNNIMLIDWTYNHMAKFTDSEHEYFLGLSQRKDKGQIFHYATQCKPWNNLALDYAEKWFEYANEALDPITYKRYYTKAQKCMRSLFISNIVKKCLNEETIIIFGYSDTGVFVKKALSLAGTKGRVLFCDNSDIKRKLKLTNIEVWSLAEAYRNCPEAIWVNVVKYGKEEVNKQIMEQGVDEDRVINYLQLDNEELFSLKASYTKSIIDEYVKVKCI